MNITWHITIRSLILRDLGPILEHTYDSLSEWVFNNWPGWLQLRNVVSPWSSECDPSTLLRPVFLNIQMSFQHNQPIQTTDFRIKNMLSHMWTIWDYFIVCAYMSIHRSVGPQEQPWTIGRQIWWTGDSWTWTRQRTDCFCSKSVTKIVFFKVRWETRGCIFRGFVCNCEFRVTGCCENLRPLDNSFILLASIIPAKNISELLTATKLVLKWNIRTEKATENLYLSKNDHVPGLGKAQFHHVKLASD